MYSLISVILQTGSKEVGRNRTIKYQSKNDEFYLIDDAIISKIDSREKYGVETYIYFYQKLKYLNYEDYLNWKKKEYELFDDRILMKC